MLKNNTGLLWFDDNPNKTIAEKVRDAANRFKQKYGSYPNLCYIHPPTLKEEKATRMNQIEIKERHSVLPHHFWIGQQSK